MSSIVNIIGMSIALLAVVSILSHVAYEWRYDDFHQDMDNAYRVSVSYTDVAGEYAEYAGLSMAIGPMLDQLPEVEASARVFQLSSALRHTIFSRNTSDEILKFNVPNAWVSDKGVFDFFTFNISEGSKTAFEATKEGVAISESLAQKLFGNGRSVGEVIEINGKHQMTITTVFKDWPENSTMHPETIIKADFAEEMEVFGAYLHFIGSETYTYIKLVDDVNLSDFDQKLKDFVEKNKRPQDYESTVLHLMSFHDIHLKADYMRGDMVELKSQKDLNMLLVLAAIIMLLAWFNCINLITSSLFKRSKNLAINRIHGAGKGSFMVQIVMETGITVALAAFFAITLRQIASESLAQMIGPGSFNDLISTPILLGALLFFLVAGTLVSALYPNLILNRLSCSELIKGNPAKDSGSAWIKHFMVTFQYGVSIVLVIVFLGIVAQINHMKSVDTQPAVDEVLVLNGPGIFENYQDLKTRIENFRNDLNALPNVQQVATSNSIPGTETYFNAILENPTIHGDGSNFIKRAFVDQFFMEVYGVDLLAGRNFNIPEAAGAIDPVIVVNRSAAENLGYPKVQDIIGQRVDYFSEPIEVVGVVEDFNMESSTKAIEPLFFYPTVDSKYISVRFSSNDVSTFIDEVRSIWTGIYPENPFDFFFANDHYNRKFSSVDSLKYRLFILTGVSITIALLGLIALVFNATHQRVKEVGIRKVLGARVIVILKIFVWDYGKRILISSILAIPLGYFILSQWLESFPYRVYPGFSALVLPTILMLGLAAGIISIQTFKLSQLNPADSLRDE